MKILKELWRDLSLKTANFLNLYDTIFYSFYTGRNFWIFKRDIVTTVVALGCSKSGDPSKRGTAI